jgi:hypothetical protein
MPQSVQTQLKWNVLRTEIVVHALATDLYKRLFPDFWTNLNSAKSKASCPSMPQSVQTHLKWNVLCTENVVHALVTDIY